MFKIDLSAFHSKVCKTVVTVKTWRLVEKDSLQNLLPKKLLCMMLVSVCVWCGDVTALLYEQRSLVSLWLIHVQLRDRDRRSQSHTDRSTYFKEAEISNYQSSSQGDKRQVVTEMGSHGDETGKKTARNLQERLWWSSALSDKLSGCNKEEQSILLREVHLLCGSSASFSDYTLNVKPHWTEQAPGRHGDRSRLWLEQRQVVTMSWSAVCWGTPSAVRR